MDKHSPKILIKVNGVKTDYKEEPTKQNVEQEEFQWVLPAEQVSYDNVVPLSTGGAAGLNMKKRKSVGKQAALIVGTAILLGTGFGFGVLHVLKGTEVAQSAPAAAMTTDAITAAASPIQEKSAARTEQVSLEGLTVYVVQGNVFSTPERGQAALEDTKAKGLPGVLSSSEGKSFLFIGVTYDEQAAKKFAASYKAEGFAAIGKQRLVGSKQVPESLKEYETTLVKTESLLRSLIEQATTLYTSGTIEDGQWSRLEKMVQELGKENVKQEEMKKMLTYVSLSYSTLKEYKDKKDEKSFLKLQQLLLDGLFSYEAAITGRNS